MSRDNKNLMASVECTNGQKMNITMFLSTNQHQRQQFKLAFPKQYNQSFPSKKSRPCCTFSHSLGTSDALRNHIRKELKVVVEQFVTVEDGREWCKQEKLRWQHNVTNLWESRQHNVAVAEATRKSRLEAFTSARIYNNENRAARTVPLPDFLGMGTASKVAQISINVRKNSRSEGHHVQISFPKKFQGRHGQRTVARSMGTKHGNSPGWLSFVSEYMLYAVTRWKTNRQARAWFLFEFENWKTFLELYFDELGRPETRDWRIGISKITALKRADYHPNADKDPGCGLFATKNGSSRGDITLVFDGRKSGLTETVGLKKNDLYVMQGYYPVEVGSTGDQLVDVPTVAALRACIVAHGFIPNDSRRPNMALDHDTDRGEATLANLGEVTEGDEMAFDYGYDSARNKTLTLKADPPIREIPDTNSEEECDYIPKKQQKVSAHRQRQASTRLATASARKTPAWPRSSTRRRTRSSTRRRHQASTRMATASSSDDDVTDWDGKPVKKWECIKVPKARLPPGHKFGKPKRRKRKRKSSRTTTRKTRKVSKPTWIDDVEDTVYPDPSNGEGYVPWNYLNDPDWSKKNINDGQCLFVAVEDEMTRVQGYSVKPYNILRQLAVNHQLSLIRSSKPKKYIQRSEASCKRMLNPRVYANDQELAALSHEIGVNVRLLYLREPPIEPRWTDFSDFQKYPERPIIRLAIVYKSGRSPHNHYMSMRKPKKEVKIRELGLEVHRL